MEAGCRLVYLVQQYWRVRVASRLHQPQKHLPIVFVAGNMFGAVFCFWNLASVFNMSSRPVRCTYTTAGATGFSLVLYYDTSIVRAAVPGSHQPDTAAASHFLGTTQVVR